MPTHQLDSLDVADLMDYYLQNPADPDVTDTDQTDPEADTESDPEVDTEPDQEADIESDQETYIELSDLEADLEVGESLPAPPADRQFATIDEATAAINKFTGENGYAVSKRRSKVDKKGDLNKIYFQCNRGRTFRSQVILFLYSEITIHSSYLD
jgi:hypothetical protein